MDEAIARALIAEHFEYAGKDEVRASEIYADDAVVEFPQGGERLRGKQNILAVRTMYPTMFDFKMRRTVGAGDVWVNEYTIFDEGNPSNVVGIMEFRDGKVFRETIYVCEPWEPPEWRTLWAEMMDED